MRILLSFALALLASAAPPRTLRVDYVHSGNAIEESFALDALSLDGPWPGMPSKPIDELNLGVFRFRVVDEASGRLLYSRGFASVFQEWQSTAEARTLRRAFHESVRFPLPAAAVKVFLDKRGPKGAFREIWSVAVDPASSLIDRAPLPRVRVWSVFQSGPPEEKVDLLLAGDGYTAAEMFKWHADAARLAGTLFSYSPFKENKSRFNVWAIDTPAPESGVSRPSDKVWRRSSLGAAYDAFGSERYVLVMDEKRLRTAAAAAPYDFLAVVVNDRKYGGGGIHNLYATVAADNAFASYVLVHELGHHIAALADEYFTADVAYLPPAEIVEPWEPNVTADPRAAKWHDLLSPGVALPTPWPKEAFETAQQKVQQQRKKLRAEGRPEAEMEALFRAELAETTRMLTAPPLAGLTGAFEGAMYAAKGLYRPAPDCIMFTRTTAGFCPVCRRALVRVFDHYSK